MPILGAVGCGGKFAVLLLTCSAWAACGNAHADEIGGSLGFVSDYVFRGVSQTRGEPAVQGSLYWRRQDDWIAGVWGSTMNPNRGPGRTQEYNAFVGTGWRLDPDWQTKLLAVHYFFPNNPRHRDWDYDELIGSLAYRDNLIATIGWAPNASAVANGALLEELSYLTYEISGRLPLWRRFSAGASAGYGETDDIAASGYRFWSLGLSYNAASWQLGLNRFSTSSDARRIYGETSTGNRWAVNLQWRFSRKLQ